MTEEREELRRLLALDRYPRSAAYDPQWVVENMMGPNPLWLAESLSRVMTLEAGMRVLDMGCGRALTSIFLAREFGVQVWATDLWVTATDNWQRIRDAGVAGQVYPVHAEAHTLPFAEGFFDAAVSLDAYQYFGTDDLYLGTFARLVRPGGQLGIVTAGFLDEPETVPPAHLAPHWNWQMCAFHSPAWWRRHWEKTGLVTVEVADSLPHGWDDWLHWNEVCESVGRGFASEAELLRADQGATLGFPRMVARRHE